VTSQLTKKWVNCAVLAGNSANLRTVLSNRLAHRELRSSLIKSHRFLSFYLPTPRWYHLNAHPFLAIHSAGEHRMIYSIWNTTSYSTFYAFFSSFKIKLWPMWLPNSKLQPLLLSTIVTRTRRHTELTKKLTNLKGNLCCAREHSVQFFVQFFYTVKPHSLT